MRVLYVIILILSSLWQVNELFAETDTFVTVDEFLREALERNPELKEAKERYIAAGFRIPQVSSLPDPTVGYMVMGPMLETRLGPQKNVFEFEQPLPFPAKLSKRHQIAVNEAEATEAGYFALKRDVILNVSKAAFDLYSVDASIKITDEMQGLLKKIEGIAQARYSAGDITQRDVAKAQVELSTTLERLFFLKQKRQSIVALINALLNRKDDVSIGEVVLSDTKPKIEKSLNELLEIALKENPKLKGDIYIAERDRQAKTLSKLEYIPDLSIGFQYIRIGNNTTTMADDGRDAWMVPLKITLPLWQNRIIPSIKEADQNLIASEARVENTKNMTVYKVKDAYYRYDALMKVVELYETALLPEAKLAFHSDEAGYEAGKIDILNMLDSERTFLNAKITYYETLAEMLKSLVELNHAVGIDVTGLPEGKI